jgi:CubicO group peptidase (beta-lactamase class C family)
MAPSRWTTTAQAFLEDWRRSGEVSAAVAAVADEDGPRVLAAVGARHDSRFDLASITKPFVATLALVLDRQGLLSLSLPIGDALNVPGPLARRHLGSLLRHRSGLAPWLPLRVLGREPSDREGLLALMAGTAGTRAACRYSDLGFIAWGWALEKTLGKGLAELMAGEILTPLGLDASVAWSPGALADSVATTCDGAKETELAAGLGLDLPLLPPPRSGLPLDGNARWLGQPAGHAGLFGTALDLLALAEEWRQPGRVLLQDDVTRALRGPGEYSLGWARRRARQKGGSAGPSLSPGSFGHTGFAGGNVWVDRAAGRSYVLLAHRTSSLSDLNPRRRAFHSLLQWTGNSHSTPFEAQIPSSRLQ